VKGGYRAGVGSYERENKPNQQVGASETLETDVNEPEINEFIDQARWLLEYHSKRSDSISTRAVALLGFAGVVLALVARTSVPQGVELGGLLRFFSGLVLVSLVVSAGCSLGALMTRQLKAPAIVQLRRNWWKWSAGKRRGSAASDIAESFLRALELGEQSVLDVAIAEPNSRGRWFRAAAIAMMVSVGSLTVVLIAVYVQLFW